ncbi:hypothetical protein IE53DRAFT_313578 [Violaceomyces palustris]|uniref:Uncharacterized protein n=1 Tax=Violaceomyces palustris TaxID=1673888 RepID=A0ACD0P0R1_9BASI|nr:hypothetical protein IE53DRAFT_313578 [Violaceomyces palustris]
MFSHSSTATSASLSKKRKACDDPDSSSADFFNVAKLSLPRALPGSLDQVAEFLPLPPDVNSAVLRSLGMDPFSSQPVTPANPVRKGHGHKISDGSDASCYFSSAQDTAGPSYPDLDIYPPTGVFGILGPQSGADQDTMDVDGDAASSRRHGPHCKSIPQLSVRHNGGTTSELWASCLDCGACSKVESGGPSTSLCYSP